MSVRVNIFNKQKNIEFSGDMRTLIRKSCAAVLKSEKFPANATVDVSIVSDEQIREINREYRGIDKATDVLSFPLGENGVFDTDPKTGAYMLGDVVSSLEHALAQGELYGHGKEREIAYLTVHSMLHLLGYDHENGGLEQMRMREKEENVLNALGLSINKV